MTGDSLHSLDMKGEFELRDGWGGCSSKQELLEQKPSAGGGGRDMPKSSWQKVERKLKLRGVKVTLQFARLTCPRAALTSLPKGRGACRLYGPELPSDLS